MLCLACYCLGVFGVGVRASVAVGCGLHGVWVCLDLLLPDVVNSVVFILLLCGVAWLFVVAYCGVC